MNIGLRLDIRQSQGLVLTPQLQQAIRLLQLSNLELAKTIESEAAENPFLNLSDAETSKKSNILDASGDGKSSNQPVIADDDGRWKEGNVPRAADSNLPVKSQSSNVSSLGESEDFERQIASRKTLVDHLYDQLSAIAMNDVERKVVGILLGYLDDDGYIREHDSALADMMGVPADVVEDCREAIQSCDPCGVGSRDLADCLRLQLKERDRFDPAMERLVNNLDMVAKADVGRLMTLCRVDEEDLRDMIAEIRSLDPKPGRNHVFVEPASIVPDIYVFPSGDTWRVLLNDETLPKVIVDRKYYADLRQSSPSSTDKEYLAERIQSASWLVKALDQRAQTIVKVTRAIFSRQKEFLRRGPAGLRPLVLKQIAEATSLHESTVSRATADKYVATPHGTFLLKYFFSTAIADATGEAKHSAEAIRLKIRKMIEQETPQAVLSDDQIVEQLRTNGVVLARRTVAKYREAMGIGSSVQRRRSKLFNKQLAETG